MNSYKPKFVTENETIEFAESILISGKTDESTQVALYCGRLDLESLHQDLFGSVRAVINVMREEFNAPFEEIDTFILSAFQEAMTKEYNNYVNNETDYALHKVVKSQEE